jgi:hypothetical protein
MGLGYQWNLDFFDQLSLTPQHNQYVLVMIKHFPKWLELMPLLNHSSERENFAFLDRVLNRLGFQLKFSLTKVCNSMGNSKSYAKKH